MWSAAASKVEEAGDAQQHGGPLPGRRRRHVDGRVGRLLSACLTTLILLSIYLSIYLSIISIYLHHESTLFNKISQLSQRSIFRRAEGVPPGALRAPHASCSRPESPPLTALAV